MEVTEHTHVHTHTHTQTDTDKDWGRQRKMGKIHNRQKYITVRYKRDTHIKRNINQQTDRTWTDRQAWRKGDRKADR